MTGKCVIIFADESNEDICEEERTCERAHRPVHDVLALGASMGSDPMDAQYESFRNQFSFNMVSDIPDFT